MATKEDNRAAVIASPGARLTVQSRAIPEPGADELLVRNHAVAANPADWKIQGDSDGSFFKTYPNVLGSDACGVVVSVGSGVTKFKPGDRVTGFAAVIYTQNADHGAWQTFTVLRQLATARVPDAMSFDHAAVFPMAVATAGVALFGDLGLPWKPTDQETAAEEKEKGIILVWGAASSVGALTVQLARSLGYTVFATAGQQRHAEWVAQLGAEKLFDYRDADVVAQIVAAAKASGREIRLAVDAASVGDTFDQVTSILQQSSPAAEKKKKVALVLPWPTDKPKPDGVEAVQCLAFRHGFDLTDMGTWLFNDWLQTALETGEVVSAPPVETIDGGIDAAQLVFDTLKAGVSGKKLVVKVP